MLLKKETIHELAFKALNDEINSSPDSLSHDIGPYAAGVMHLAQLLEKAVDSEVTVNDDRTTDSNSNNKPCDNGTEIEPCKAWMIEDTLTRIIKLCNNSLRKNRYATVRETAEIRKAAVDLLDKITERRN